MSTGEASPPGPSGPSPSAADGYFAGLAYGRAKKAFWLGVASVVCFGPVLGIPAIVVGRRSLKEISASRGRLRGRAWAWRGIVLGVVGTLGWIVFAARAG